jgi:RNA polymerase primary sigma factor
LEGKWDTHGVGPGRFQPLTRDREAELIEAWSRGDEDAREAIIGSSLRLVFKLAHRHQRMGVSFPDLVGAGNWGLVEALDHFDPVHGVRFVTYAAYWIRARMLELVRQRSSMVHRPPLVLRQGIPRDAFLDAPGRDGTPHEARGPLGATPEALLAERESTLLAREVLAEVRSGLTPRELQILDERLLASEAVSLRELGQRCGVSRERVRQLEVALKQKLRPAFEAAGLAP